MRKQRGVEAKGRESKGVGKQKDENAKGIEPREREAPKGVKGKGTERAGVRAVESEVSGRSQSGVRHINIAK